MSQTKENRVPRPREIQYRTLARDRRGFKETTPETPAKNIALAGGLNGNPARDQTIA
jgi:hypothetical protein